MRKLRPRQADKPVNPSALRSSRPPPPKPPTLDPVIVRRRVRTISYRILSAHSTNHAACRRIADELAQAIADAHSINVKALAGIPPLTQVSWDQYGICRDAPNRDIPKGCDPAMPSGIVEGNGVPQAMGQPPARRLSSGIDRTEVLGLLRQLMVRASDGEVSVGDSVRLAEAIGRLEGLAQQAQPDLIVQLIQYSDLCSQVGATSHNTDYVKHTSSSTPTTYDEKSRKGPGEGGIRAAPDTEDPSPLPH